MSPWPQSFDLFKSVIEVKTHFNLNLLIEYYLKKCAEFISMRNFAFTEKKIELFTKK